MILYRPVGEKEWKLIHDSGCKSFPLLDGEPFFKPVLEFDYACQLARDWNTKDPSAGMVGYVTQFRMDGRYARRYSADHHELHVPAAEIAKFNEHIDGYIEVIAEFRLERDLSC